MKDIADLLGRILLGTIFLYEAIDSMLFYDNMKSTMLKYGINFSQDFFLRTAIILLFIGSITVIIGYFARVGAAILFVYWFIFTSVVYSFWNDPIDLQRANALSFIRNMAICGGLLMVMAHGSGKYSIKRMIHVMKLPK
jgi:putative oxidoreductase